MQRTRVNINLDGYRPGEAVTWHATRVNQHGLAEAQFNRGAMRMPVDLQTA